MPALVVAIAREKRGAAGVPYQRKRATVKKAWRAGSGFAWWDVEGKNRSSNKISDHDAGVKINR